jgi:anthranilate phosphoribosyltransferase
MCAPIARVLQSLGTRRAMVVCGRIEAELPAQKSNVERGPNPAPIYLDELSTLGENSVAEFYQEKGFAVSVLRPDFDLQPARLADLQGGDSSANAKIILRILSGEEQGPKREAVLLNAGAALFVAAKSRSIDEGWLLSSEIIQSGRALQKFRDLKKSFPV